MKSSSSFPGQVKPEILTNNAGFAPGFFTFFLTITLVAQLACSNAFSEQLTLAWDPITAQEVTGYRIYYGPSSGFYTHSIDVGTGTFDGTEVSYTVTGLPDGLYYFAATAYDSHGIESTYSNEVSAPFPYIKPPILQFIQCLPE
jgi:hypothetical protein